MEKQFFKRGDFYYLLCDGWLIEIKAEWLEPFVTYAVQKEAWISINWKREARIIKESTFRRVYNQLSKLNPGMPKIRHLYKNFDEYGKKKNLQIKSKFRSEKGQDIFQKKENNPPEIFLRYAQKKRNKR